ncbi:MAG: hypothetical protein ABEK04_02725 [Candidatus Nanohalobium sp.]
MSKISELLEEDEDEKEENQSQETQEKYNIFSIDTEGDEITLLNFSDTLGKKEYLPDYTATRKDIEQGLELWEVNTEERPSAEIEIESYEDKHDLASQLQESYEEKY